MHARGTRRVVLLKRFEALLACICVLKRVWPLSCACSTVGRALADRLGCAFFDGDDFHTEANKCALALPC